MAAIALVQSADTSALILNILPIAVIIGIFYFLVIAPANKQRKKTETMLGALKKGDRVLTSGGLYGTIQGVESDVVYLKVADNVKLKVARAAVTSVLGEGAD